jgi:hypothetical protein
MSNFDTAAGKRSGFTPFEHIFIVKTRLNHARPRGLPAVSILVMDELIRGKLFSEARYQATPIFAHPAYCSAYHQERTWSLIIGSYATSLLPVVVY